MKKVGVLYVLLLISSFAVCQVNSHYWSHQYGSKGLLLNGAVIASVTDETAIFYNPGAMALNDEFGLSLSLITPRYSVLRTTDFLGENTSFSDKGLGLAPGMAAALFKPFGTDKVSLGLTTFQRFKSGINVEDRIINGVSGNNDQIFLGDVNFNKRVSESWFGLGLSFRLHPKFAIGFTQFLTFRGERVRINFKKEILDRVNPQILISGWRSEFEYGYSANGGSLIKMGMSWQPGDIKIGATFTTRAYGLIHRSADYAFDDQKIFVDGRNTSSSNDRSVSLNEYVTPWSIGFGLEMPIGVSTVSISAEYFSKVNEYDLINDVDDPLDGQSPNPETTTVVVSERSNRVLNLALGVEQFMNEKYTWFYGFRTDFSPRSILDLGEGISFLSSTPNIFHASTGAAYSYRKSQFSVGIDYGFGYKVGGKQLTDISKITLDNIFTFSGDDSVNTFTHQFSLFITYDL